MKNNILLGCLLSAAVLSTSCSDFLDEKPQGMLIPENYFSTQDELNMSVYALYNKVNASQTFTNMQYPHWQGDDITTNPGSNKQAAAELDRFAPTNSNKGVKDCWNRHYEIIKAANMIINNGGKTPTTEEEKNVAIGQARYWRAYAYFTLVRLFGPLPMNMDNVNDDFTLELSPVETVYKYILEDLEAAESLPSSYSAAPRFMNGVNVYVTQQAVKSTLAAVYMAMAGWPLYKGAEYYAKAADKALEVISKESEYGLELDNDYKNVYAMSNNYNKETVLGINYSPIVDWSQDSQLTSCNVFESLGGWGDGWGEIRFWKRFPEGPRKDATYDPKILLTDGTLVNWWDKKPDGTPYVNEYHPMFSVFTVNWDPVTKKNIDAPYDYKLPKSQNMCNGHRHRLIRYSEVLLWYAEAAARSGKGDMAMAKQCLKRVRARAVNSDQVNTVDGVAIDNMSNEQLANAAYQEHGWEVAGYWVALVTRRSDQFRMNELKNTFAERAENAPVEIVSGVTATEGVLLVNKTWNDDLMYLPYPDTDSQKNPNLRR